MRCISFVLSVIVIASFCSVDMVAGDVEIALEAEMADKIQSPMVIAVPADAEARGGPEPDEPSNGKFIWAPGAPVTGGGNGSAEFTINIPEDGTYTIWGRAIAWDGNSDSFYVTWDPADQGENAQQTQNPDLCWCATNGNTWTWDRVNRWPAGGDREWELDKGETKLTIWTREDATMLDCLFITDNLSADLGVVVPRLPTDEDIKIQRGMQAVGAAGKLSTTWASIKDHWQACFCVE
jgi:hypothetical protein